MPPKNNFSTKPQLTQFLLKRMLNEILLDPKSPGVLWCLCAPPPPPRTGGVQRCRPSTHEGFARVLKAGELTRTTPSSTQPSLVPTVKNFQESDLPKSGSNRSSELLLPFAPYDRGKQDNHRAFKSANLREAKLFRTSARLFMNSREEKASSRLSSFLPTKWEKLFMVNFSLSSRGQSLPKERS